MAIVHVQDLEIFLVDIRVCVLGTKQTLLVELILVNGL